MVSFLTGVATGGGLIVKAVKDDADLVGNIEATGATVRAIHDSAVGITSIGGVVAYHEDARASTPDGAVFVPGVAGEGLLGGNLTPLNGATALTIEGELAVQPAASAGGYVFSRNGGIGATTFQLGLFVNGDRFNCFVANGATVANIASAVGSIPAGGRLKYFVRLDLAAGTDITKVTYWLSALNTTTQVFPVVTQSTSTAIVAGVPAALITLASANVALGRRADSTANPFLGLIGGNGTTVNVYPSALTEAQMNDLVSGAITPASLSALLSYNFSGATPLTNLGTAGAVGDLTAGANTPIVSGDRRYFGLASAGTSRPTYNTAGVYPAKVYDGVNDYDRSVARGQLESVTADQMDIYICAPPVGSGNRMLGQSSNGTTNRLSGAWNTGVANAYEARVSGGVNATIAGPLAGARCLLFYRDGTGASTTSAIRIGLGAEVSVTTTGDTSAAVTRRTIGASRLDTPSQFADMTLYVVLTVRGVTSSSVRQQIAEICSAYAARYCGATVV